MSKLRNESNIIIKLLKNLKKNEFKKFYKIKDIMKKITFHKKEKMKNN